MAIRTYRPTSAGMRFRTGLTFEEVTKTRPEKGLTESGLLRAAGATTPAESPQIIAAAATSVCID